MECLLALFLELLLHNAADVCLGESFAKETCCSCDTDLVGLPCLFEGFGCEIFHARDIEYSRIGLNTALGHDLLSFIDQESKLQLTT